mmetsp:Transcript_29698/g.59695  ORF Transcript_29698/g.59695 Transcript_29698/m.59695 type:complete len:389 (+) Transcript_29698:363-1529(+)
MTGRRLTTLTTTALVPLTSSQVMVIPGTSPPMVIPGTSPPMETVGMVVTTSPLTTSLHMEMEIIGMVVTRAAAGREPTPRSAQLCRQLCRQLCHQLFLLRGKTTATKRHTIPTRTRVTPIKTTKHPSPTTANQVPTDPTTEICQITIKQVPMDPTMEDTAGPIHRTIKEAPTAVDHPVEISITSTPMDHSTDRTQKTTTQEDLLLTVEDPTRQIPTLEIQLLTEDLLMVDNSSMGNLPPTLTQDRLLTVEECPMTNQLHTISLTQPEILLMEQVCHYHTLIHSTKLEEAHLTAEECPTNNPLPTINTPLLELHHTEEECPMTSPLPTIRIQIHLMADHHLTVVDSSTVNQSRMARVEDPTAEGTCTVIIPTKAKFQPQFTVAMVDTVN